MQLGKWRYAILTGVSNAIFTSNKVLVAAPHAEEMILRPHLSRVRLVAGQVLIEQGQATEHVHFMESGVAALLAQSAAAQPAVQIAMIGREGLVGALALLGSDTPAFGKVVMLLPGTALRIPVAALQRVLERTPVLEALSLSWVAALTRQLMHAVASSATDTLMIRCARWLLMAHFRNEGDDLPVTHELIATSLGVRRAGVTLAVMSLQQSGLIRTTRGRIRMLDRPGMGRLVEQDDGSRPIKAFDAGLPLADPPALQLDTRLLRQHNLQQVPI